MAKNHFYAVIMSGGRGERFWPLSTSQHPKQLLPLFCGKPLLTCAIDRVRTIIPLANILVITHQDLVAATTAAVPDLPRANLIGEPQARDTAAAVALGTALVKARDPDAVFSVLTADHIIGKEDAFARILQACHAQAAAGDWLLTIGIPPTCPSTGFGYIEAGESFPAASGFPMFRAKRFVEKPDTTTAAEYVRSGRFYWNSGMFVWSVAAIERALTQFRPPLARMLAAVLPRVDTPEFDTVVRTEYALLEKISIDYAVMEKAPNILMVPGAMEWDDVGSWTALANHFPCDSDGNIALGAVTQCGTTGTIVVSEGGHLTALLGVQDLIVVQAPGATLVCSRERAQEIKKLVEQVKHTGKFEHLL